MKPMTLGEIAQACGGQFVGNKSKLLETVKSVVIDSRLVKEGSLFVAIKGTRTDGHKYAGKAYELGAVCVISEEVLSADNPYILVKSSEQAIKDIAEYYRSLFYNIEVVGITGSVGKTSTKEMIASVLSCEYVVHKTQGNFNNELGVPLTLLAMPEDTEVAVIEMGISGFGEMTRLSKMVRPTVCVITNIGYCHLENLKDRDGVLKAKTEMFKFKQDDALIFVNGDDDKLRTVEGVSAFFGLGNTNDYYADNIVNTGENSVSCRMCLKGKFYNVTVPALGDYMVINALCAAAVGQSLNMSDENIIKGIGNYKTVGSRASLVKTELFNIIDDCYNANPNSVKAALDTLKSIKGGRKAAVLGDMKELGENEAELHRSIGRYLSSLKIDVVVTVGKLAKYIADSAENVEKYSFDTIEAAIEELDSILHKNDTVLVKASHSMHFEKIVESLKEL